jgi:hypothetical protein
MKHLLFICLFFTALQAYPQPGLVTERHCGTVVPDQAWDSWFNARVEEFRSTQAAQKEQVQFTIPVIFHVIHGGEPLGTYPNISTAQIYSQISILNFDFGGFGFNSGNFSSTSFPASLKANTEINFCLAEKNPQGNVLFERGVERINYNDKGWANPASFGSTGALKNFIDNTVKANTIWDPTRYLNVWVTDVNGSVNLLGYATFPPSSGLSGVGGVGTATDDGLWCWGKAVGDVGFLTPNYDKGRTATHEIGHYLGLRHIWGDTNCGTDYCNDTPTQQTSNNGCPSFPKLTCSNGPNGELFMNFMDYSYDNCMYMFTNDQRTRMQTALTNSPLRNQLTASSATVCGTVGMEERRASSSFSGLNLFPNPSTGRVYVTVGTQATGSLKTTVYNVLGQPVYCHLAEPSASHKFEIDLSSQPAGIYFVEISSGQEKLVKRLVLAR